MLGMDFEPTNGHLLQGKMFNGRDARFVYVRRRPRPRPRQEKRLKMEGSGYKEPTGNTNYPAINEKKIFGMRPKTLGVALGVIVISIWVLSKTRSNNPQVMAQGGAMV